MDNRRNASYVMGEGRRRHVCVLLRKRGPTHKRRRRRECLEARAHAWGEPFRLGRHECSTDIVLGYPALLNWLGKRWLFSGTCMPNAHLPHRVLIGRDFLLVGKGARALPSACFSGSGSGSGSVDQFPPSKRNSAGRALGPSLSSRQGEAGIG
jgi:hypothetical protein